MTTADTIVDAFGEKCFRLIQKPLPSDRHFLIEDFLDEVAVIVDKHVTSVSGGTQLERTELLTVIKNYVLFGFGQSIGLFLPELTMNSTPIAVANANSGRLVQELDTALSNIIALPMTPRLRSFLAQDQDRTARAHQGLRRIYCSDEPFDEVLRSRPDLNVRIMERMTGLSPQSHYVKWLEHLPDAADDICQLVASWECPDLASVLTIIVAEEQGEPITLLAVGDSELALPSERTAMEMNRIAASIQNHLDMDNTLATGMLLNDAVIAGLSPLRAMETVLVLSRNGVGKCVDLLPLLPVVEQNPDAPVEWCLALAGIEV